MKLDEAIKQLEASINYPMAHRPKKREEEKRLKELRALQALAVVMKAVTFLEAGTWFSHFGGALLDYLFAKEGLDR